jgi:hypothetical protein
MRHLAYPALDDLLRRANTMLATSLDLDEERGRVGHDTHFDQALQYAFLAPTDDLIRAHGELADLAEDDDDPDGELARAALEFARQDDDPFTALACFLVSCSDGLGTTAEYLIGGGAWVEQAIDRILAEDAKDGQI